MSTLNKVMVVLLVITGVAFFWLVSQRVLVNNNWKKKISALEEQLKNVETQNQDLRIAIYGDPLKRGDLDMENAGLLSQWNWLRACVNGRAWLNLQPGAVSFHQDTLTANTTVYLSNTPYDLGLDDDSLDPVKVNSIVYLFDSGIKSSGNDTSNPDPNAAQSIADSGVGSFLGVFRIEGRTSQEITLCSVFQMTDSEAARLDEASKNGNFWNMYGDAMPELMDCSFAQKTSSLGEIYRSKLLTLSLIVKSGEQMSSEAMISFLGLDANVDSADEFGLQSLDYVEMNTQLIQGLKDAGVALSDTVVAEFVARGSSRAVSSEIVDAVMKKLDTVETEVNENQAAICQDGLYQIHTQYAARVSLNLDISQSTVRLAQIKDAETMLLVLIGEGIPEEFSALVDQARYDELNAAAKYENYVAREKRLTEELEEMEGERDLVLAKLTDIENKITEMEQTQALLVKENRRLAQELTKTELELVQKIESRNKGVSLANIEPAERAL